MEKKQALGRSGNPGPHDHHRIVIIQKSHKETLRSNDGGQLRPPTHTKKKGRKKEALLISSSLCWADPWENHDMGRVSSD